MTRSIRTSAVVAAMALGVSALPAHANETEIIGIFNSAENDSTYVSASLRYSFGDSLDSGLILRGDIARGNYGFNVGGTSVDGTIDTLRLLLGYAIPFGDNKLTFWGGVSSRERTHSPLVAPLVDEDGVGGFAAIEYDAVLPGQGNFSALAEYDSVFHTTYTSAYAVWEVGGVMVGPTANLLWEDDYERRALGLRVQAPLGNGLELVLTGAWAEGGSNGNLDVDSSYIELQFSSRF
ncbi:cellulose biosynthesis protein BcsS [Roseicyclus persicicus]|uniref:Cellulose biosynthesis protein BcsS n=1 Tax=Roseicyclus persicicus TaxID=2650661 RepID=A0A7X6JW56_9RHOB|nr:cellulose biosynthesis protein BcsS [Roseibacterium persicicum]NKX44007.1 hypothetical protein [Roseibacterium persicicum]